MICSYPIFRKTHLHIGLSAFILSIITTYQPMKQLMILLFLTSITASLFGQYSNYKRFQYDEFIYGLTVPNLKNIEAIADYYQVDKKTIQELNRQFGNTELAYKKYQIIYLPAGTLLNNTNVGFEKLSAAFETLPTYDVDSTLLFPFQDDFTASRQITDTFVIDFLATEVTSDCIENCFYAVAKINLGKNYIGFIVHEAGDYNPKHHLYIYYHNDFLRRIDVSELVQGESGHAFSSTMFKDFDNDGSAEILIRTAIESYHYDRLLYEHSYQNYYWRFFQTDDYMYQCYKVVDGNYLIVSMDFILGF